MEGKKILVLSNINSKCCMMDQACYPSTGETEIELMRDTISSRPACATW